MPVGAVVFDDRSKFGYGDVRGDRLLGQPDGTQVLAHAHSFVGEVVTKCPLGATASYRDRQV